MTVSVIQFRPDSNDLICIADSRISSGDSVATDSGAKILPIPVSCHKLGKGPKNSQWHEARHYSFGYSFAGSTITAIGTHALATACTQNLAAKKKNPETPSVRSIAQLFREVAEFYIADVSSRLVGTRTSPTDYFFMAFIFGYCPLEKSYKIFGIAPKIVGGRLKVLLANCEVSPWGFHPIGSGEKVFVETHRQLIESGKPASITAALKDMLDKDVLQSVGGHIQIGIANQKGFTLKPILGFSGEEHLKLRFLGFPVTGLDFFKDYSIGYDAFSPELEFFGHE